MARKQEFKELADLRSSRGHTRGCARRTKGEDRSAGRRAGQAGARNGADRERPDRKVDFLPGPLNPGIRQASRKGRRWAPKGHDSRNRVERRGPTLYSLRALRPLRRLAGSHRAGLVARESLCGSCAASGGCNPRDRTRCKAGKVHDGDRRAAPRRPTASAASVTVRNPPQITEPLERLCLTFGTAYDEP